MIKKITFTFLLLLSFVLYSCEKDGDALGGEDNTESTDSFDGEFKEMSIAEQLEFFDAKNFTCVISAPDGSIITRDGSHLRNEGVSLLTFERGLAKGVYRFLALRYQSEENVDYLNYKYDEFGLGFRIEIGEDNSFKIIDTYSSSIGLNGSGVEGDPYIVCSSDHLIKLRTFVNTDSSNKTLNSDTRFSQTADIDLAYASWKSDNNCGWNAIGALSNCPFIGQYDGDGHSITNMFINRPTSAAIGLFGFIQNAQITNVKIVDPNIIGHFGVSGLVGCVTTPGDQNCTSMIVGCTTDGGSVVGTDGGIGVGGLVGMVDMYSKAFLSNCNNQGTSISGAYAVGGLLGGGALTSGVNIDNSQNSASVSSTNTGAGGLVGALDTLLVTSSVNKGTVIGSTSDIISDTDGRYGTGGIVGGAGSAQIFATTNSGDITGYIGVGGIIGSTRIGGETLMYNNVLVKTSHNTGDITGTTNVGGICGEAQFGGYALLNEGVVHATGSIKSQSGGICGNCSIAVVYNAVNGGDVICDCTYGGAVGGIVSKSDWGSYLTCQNFGNVTGGTQYSAGIVGLTGNYTMMNFCSNAGTITNSNPDGIAAGIIGELGDQREWSAENICACIFGSMDIALGILGPTLAIIGKSADKLSEIGKEVVHVLHIGELYGGFAPVIAETVMLGVGIDEMVSGEEAELMESEMSAQLETRDNDIKQTIADYRRNFNVSSAYFQTGINSSAHTNFTSNIEDINSYIEQSEDNNDEINENINYRREERLEDIEAANETQEIWQKVVSGICIAVTTAATIVSFCATAGTATAIAATVTLAASSVVGGVNAVVEGATDYADNVAIVSQCANYGPINSVNQSQSSGIVAEANDNCWIKDCVNTASNISGNSSDVSSIVGSPDNKVIIDRCLALGTGWSTGRPSSSSVIYQAKDGASSSDNYVYTVEELINIDRYKDLEWDITSNEEIGEYSIWQLNPTVGEIPTPFITEMQNVMMEE